MGPARGQVRWGAHVLEKWIPLHLKITPRGWILSRVFLVPSGAIPGTKTQEGEGWEPGFCRSKSGSVFVPWVSPGWKVTCLVLALLLASAGLGRKLTPSQPPTSVSSAINREWEHPLHQVVLTQYGVHYHRYASYHYPYPPGNPGIFPLPQMGKLRLMGTVCSENL